MATTEMNCLASGGGKISDITVQFTVNESATTTTLNVDNTKGYYILNERRANIDQYYEAKIIGGTLDVIHDSITSTGYVTVTYSSGVFTMVTTSGNNIRIVEIS